MSRVSILLIYTGGTIGMRQDAVTSALVPFNFSQITEEVPELKRFGYNIDSYSFDPLIDSSDASPRFWIDIAKLIEDNYSKYDGFVVLHGTDTMSYTASALSFMFENLEKPVVLTGSQLPIGMLRTDGKENLISAIEIAAAKRKDGYPMVPEVAVYFENQLFRGNRTVKYSAETFNAFRSDNYPPLAEIGISIRYNKNNIRYPESWGNKLVMNTNLDNRVAILKIFPGIGKETIESILSISGLRAVVLESFGSGNAPSKSWFTGALKIAIEKGLIVLNITQCMVGSVNMEAYSTGLNVKETGVLGGYDMTTEAAITKLFFLLGQTNDTEEIKQLMRVNLRGEVSIN